MAPAIISQCGYSIDEKVFVISRRDSWQIHIRCRHSSNLPSIHRFLIEPVLAIPRFLERYFNSPHSSLFSFRFPQ